MLINPSMTSVSRLRTDLGRRNDNIVILRDLERVETFLCLGRVQHTGIDRLGDRVVDQFTQNQTV